MTDMPAPAAPLDTLLAHRDWVRRVARALARDDDDAGDIEQSAWLAAVASPPPSPDAPRAWLATVLRRAAARMRRGESRRGAREAAVARREATASVEESVAEAESHERVVRAVLALPEPYRGTVVLRYFEDLPPREIAARTAVSADTVRTRLRRAKDLLRDALRDERGDFRAAIAPLLAERLRPPAGPAVAASAGLSAAFVLKCIAAAVLAAASIFAVEVGLRGTSPDGTVTGEGETPAPARAGAATSEAASLSRRPRRADRAPSESGAEKDEGSPAPGAMGEVAVLVERDDAPLADVLVVVHDHAAQVASGRTGADGRARLALPAPRLAGGLGLVLVPRDGAPGTAIVESDRETRVSLGSRARVEGIVRVDGVAPGEPLALTLRWRAPRFDTAVAPQPVWDALAKDGVTPASITVACDAAGGFAFLAPMDEALDLEIDEHLQWTDYAAQTGRLRAPRTGLVLDAVRLPSLRGRVVDADGRTPLPGAELQLTIDEDGAGEGSMSCVRSAGAEGRFDVPFPGPRSRLLALSVSGPDGRGERTVELPATIPQRWDAGDVPIGRTRRVEFVVTGEGGAPVEAAVAYAETASGSPSVASDAEGCGSVLLPLTPCRIRVAAPGFDVAVADVPAGATEPVRVSLVHGRQLVVTVPPAYGEMNVRVESDTAMFTGPDGQFDSAFAHAQSPFPFECSYSAGGRMDALFSGAGGGVLAIDGLRDHVRLRVSLVDALGFVVAASETELATRERRVLELKPAREPRTIRGRVVLAAGGPAAGASVRLAAGDGIPVDLVADDDGQFSLAGVCASGVRALVQHPGFAPAVSALEPAAGESEAVVTLREGRSVRVFVADASGRPVDDAEVDALCSEFGDWGCGGVTVAAEPEGRGVYALTGLPAGACVVRAAGGGGRGTATAGAADAEIRVVVAPAVEPSDR
jgi:RNA polymerase sigma-70 factor (ECF subfamily)